MRLIKITTMMLIVGMAMCVEIYTKPVMAEIYIGGQAGVNMPKDLKNIKGTGDSSGFKAGDLKLKKSVAGGLKFGGFFPDSLNWLGLEGEMYYSKPDIKKQQITVTGSGFSNSGTLQKANVHMGTVVLNAIIRYPGEIIQPYGGAGVGVNAAYIKGNDNFDRDLGIGPSLNFLGGLRVFVSEQVALFTEYKYNRGKLKFFENEFKADYQANSVLGGLTYHFN